MKALFLLWVIPSLAQPACDTNAVHEDDEATFIQAKMHQQRTALKSPRTVMLERFWHHWQWAADEGVVINGRHLSCNVLPSEIRSGQTLDNYCSDADEAQAPTWTQVERYFGWAEHWCTDVTDASLLAHCVMKTSGGLGQTSADLHVDQVALDQYNEAHQQDLQEEQHLCPKLFDEGGECHDLVEELQQRVVSIRWRTKDIGRDLRRFAGMLHSFLEIKTVDHNRYFVDVFPLQRGSQTQILASSTWRKDQPSWGTEGQTHAEASATMLRPNLSVADVIQYVRDNAGEYHLIKNNCHHVTANAFKWAAPDAQDFPQPNPKWSVLGRTMDIAAPQVTADIVAALGLGSQRHG